MAVSPLTVDLLLRRKVDTINSISWTICEGAATGHIKRVRCKWFNILLTQKGNGSSYKSLEEIV